MPLLRNGQWADNNPWIRLEDEDALPKKQSSEAPVLCSLKRFIELAASNTPHSISGVWLSSDDDVTELAKHLEHVQLVKKGDELWSRQAALAYPIRDGIPVMLEDEARPLKLEEAESIANK